MWTTPIAKDYGWKSWEKKRQIVVEDTKDYNLIEDNISVPKKEEFYSFKVKHNDCNLNWYTMYTYSLNSNRIFRSNYQMKSKS